MLQAVWFDAGAGRSGRLLLTVHHLSVDGVSWRILVPDLAAGYAAAARGEAPQLPPRGTSLRGWASGLAHAGSAAVVDELPFWRGMLEGPRFRLPRRARCSRDCWARRGMFGSRCRPR